MKKRHIPTKQELVARKLTLAKVLLNRKRKIAPQTIALAIGLGKDGYAWVTAQFRHLESADLMKQHSRVRWSVVPGVTLGKLYLALGLSAAEMPDSGTIISRVIEGPAAPSTPKPQPGPDLLVLALKAERFDRLVAKYGAAIIANALGLTEL